MRLSRTASGPAGGMAPPIVHAVLAGAGRPLEPGTRALMESRLRHDFGTVRIHADDRAGRSARAVGATAYTVGSDVVFAPRAYQPGTADGRRLLAHELAHVVQQGNVTRPPANLIVGPADDPAEREADAASRAVDVTTVRAHPAAGVVRRELATPPPAVAPAAQPDLTEAEIRAAIRFNSTRYNAANTRIIQDIVGAEVTGTWTAATITAIAAIQEEHGLTKDGKVGPDLFRFLDTELTLEGVDTTTPECLTMFRVVTHPVQTAATPGPGGTTRIRGHHVVEAEFSPRCNCSEFQYRQFIAGAATGSRGAVAQDFSPLFVHIPGGLPLVMTEDSAPATCTDRNYGHRDQPGQASTTATCGQDRYADDAGATDQPNGCRYRGEDFPQLQVTGLQTGDDVDLLVQFRGEIRRNGTVVQTKQWTTIETAVRTP